MWTWGRRVFDGGDAKPGYVEATGQKHRLHIEVGKVAMKEVNVTLGKMYREREIVTYM